MSLPKTSCPPLSKVSGDLESLAARRKENRRILSLAMTLSLGFGLLMLAIKMGTYLLTGSAAILSDAAESVVHVAAVFVCLLQSAADSSTGR